MFGQMFFSNTCIFYVQKYNGVHDKKINNIVVPHIFNTCKCQILYNYLIHLSWSLNGLPRNLVYSFLLDPRRSKRFKKQSASCS